MLMVLFASTQWIKPHFVHHAEGRVQGDAFGNLPLEFENGTGAVPRINETREVQPDELFDEIPVPVDGRRHILYFPVSIRW